MRIVLNVENVSKSFASIKQKEVILDNFSLQIQNGQIYCLLGASGCGKSTLSSCILGLQKVDSGIINVFQEKVVHKKLIKSSHYIGYMPQDTALPMQMTVKETLNLFANLNQMNMKFFKSRYEVLMGILELHKCNALIQDLSGGEQRKVSLAVALIHNPKFVILDEPTVGLDPLICSNIWNFLIQSKGNLTVLMTTHYPYEAEKADICGYMRNGKLLADDTPANVMEILNVSSLDEACYKMCSEKISLCQLSIIEIENESVREFLMDDWIDNRKTSSMQIIKAIATKKVIMIKRFGKFTSLAIIAPIYTFILLLLIFGRSFQNLNIGIVNEDSNDCQLSFNGFNNNIISCSFLNLIPENNLKKVTYMSIEQASEDSRCGNTVGFVYIPKNFSNEFLKIRNYEDVSMSSQINIFLDVSDIYKDKFTKGVLVKTYENFIQEMMKKYDKKYKVFLNPIRIQSYDENMDIGDQSSIAKLVIPAMYLLTLVFISITTLCGSLIFDKSEKVWNRMLLCGVNVNHLLFIEFSLSFSLAVVHVIVTVLLKTILVNFIEIKDYLAFCLLIAIISMIGSMYGLFLAILFQSLRLMISSAFGLMVVFTFSSGMLMPIESMDPHISVILNKLPIGLISTVLRDIIFKGYDLSSHMVHKAIYLSGYWIFGLFLVSYLYLKKNKYVF